MEYPVYLLDECLLHPHDTEVQQKLEGGQVCSEQGQKGLDFPLWVEQDEKTLMIYRCSPRTSAKLADAQGKELRFHSVMSSSKGRWCCTGDTQEEAEADKNAMAWRGDEGWGTVDTEKEQTYLVFFTEKMNISGF